MLVAQSALRLRSALAHREELAYSGRYDLFFGGVLFLSAPIRTFGSGKDECGTRAG
jgi:hypothetical protein